MHLIKSYTGQTILFDDGEMLILNKPRITSEQRYFTAIFIILIAIAGISINLSDEPKYSLIAFILLLVYGVGYFLIYFVFRRNDPVRIQYSEINGIDIKSNKKSVVLSVNYSNSSKLYRIKAKQMDPDIIKFLESRNLVRY